jgi:hypothetical protein
LTSELLQKVKALFFQATRIDPHDRIRLEKFSQCIHALKTAVVKTQSNSAVLYQQPEHVYLVHQKALTERAMLKTAIHSTATRERSGFPVRLCWYQNKADHNYHEPGSAIETHCLQSVNALMTTLETQDIGSLSTPTLTHSMYQLWRFYYKYRYEKHFSGTIHLFSFDPFDREAFEPLPIGERTYTFNQFLEYLQQLTHGEMNIVFHTSHQPDPSVEETGYVMVTPAEDGLHCLSRPATDTGKSAAGSQQNAHPAAAESPEEVQPKIPVEQLYLLGSEGLFFLDGEGRKIYVTRKKIRR